MKGGEKRKMNGARIFGSWIERLELCNLRIYVIRVTKKLLISNNLRKYRSHSRSLSKSRAY